ncbi:hypothetical protein WMY93_021487 [Mugilogobius chulae]|uniref:Uncharacterized protein n=1 Tax=Mugilogobius chulae TaxID=88201 RepID=A0AAW0NLC2_9GOBI
MSIQAPQTRQTQYPRAPHPTTARGHGTHGVRSRDSPKSQHAPRVYSREIQAPKPDSHSSLHKRSSTNNGETKLTCFKADTHTELTLSAANSGDTENTYLKQGQRKAVGGNRLTPLLLKTADPVEQQTFSLFTRLYLICWRFSGPVSSPVDGLVLCLLLCTAWFCVFSCGRPGSLSSPVYGLVLCLLLWTAWSCVFSCGRPGPLSSPVDLLFSGLTLARPALLL